MNGGIEYVWVEVYGVPRHRRLQGETPNDTIRIYPDHLFIKLEVV